MALLKLEAYYLLIYNAVSAAPCANYACLYEYSFPTLTKLFFAPLKAEHRNPSRWSWTLAGRCVILPLQPSVQHPCPPRPCRRVDEWLVNFISCAFFIRICICSVTQTNRNQGSKREMCGNRLRQHLFGRDIKQCKGARRDATFASQVTVSGLCRETMIALLTFRTQHACHPAMVWERLWWRTASRWCQGRLMYRRNKIHESVSCSAKVKHTGRWGVPKQHQKDLLRGTSGAHLTPWQWRHAHTRNVRDSAKVVYLAGNSPVNSPFAMDRSPGMVCLIWKFSSANFEP